MWSESSRPEAFFFAVSRFFSTGIVWRWTFGPSALYSRILVLLAADGITRVAHCGVVPFNWHLHFPQLHQNPTLVDGGFATMPGVEEPTQDAKHGEGSDLC